MHRASFLEGEAIDSELVWVGPPGAQSALLVSGHQLRRQDGSPLGSALIAQDITEVVRAGREREDALATLAHELRTPLTSILGYIDLIEMQGVAPGAEKSFQVIARNAEHLRTLCASFLNGVRDVDYTNAERLNISEMVHMSVAVHQGAHHGSSRRWVVDVQPGLSGYSDRGGMLEVLANVMENAVKYSPTSGLIEVTATASQR